MDGLPTKTEEEKETQIVFDLASSAVLLSLGMAAFLA
jgi:hypothetical protein